MNQQKYQAYRVKVHSDSGQAGLIFVITSLDLKETIKVAEIFELVTNFDTIRVGKTTSELPNNIDPIEWITLKAKELYGENCEIRIFKIEPLIDN
ncbi:MAG: hypothetical protein IPO86_13090 [Saprospiraceae bacterium]|nr:hypothetical protein [Saprospiraceae bacterium]